MREEASAFTSRTLPQHDVGGAFAWHVAGTLVSERAQIEPLPEWFTLAKHNGTNGEVQLVDQAGAQVLANRRDAAAEPDVAVLRRLFRALERGVDAVRDEMKDSAALHGQRPARV